MAAAPHSETGARIEAMKPFRSYTSHLLLALLLILFAVFALLQYRWTGEVSRAELERMRESLGMAAARFSDDFDAELVETASFFAFGRKPNDQTLSDYYLQRFGEWKNESFAPELVGSILILEFIAVDEMSAYRLGGDDERFRTIDSLPELDSLLELIGSRQNQLGPRRRLPFIVAPEVPALALELRTPGGRGIAGGARGNATGFRGTPEGFLILELDLDYMQTELLPQLSETHFGTTSASDYDLTVVAGDGGVVYTSKAGSADIDISSADLVAPLFLFRPPGGFGRGFRQPGPAPEESMPRGASLGRRGRRSMPTGPGSPPGENSWMLLVRHHAGSLETYVESLRRRNLGISLGILVVFAGAVVMMAIASQRAQKLARQQVEFVAGISHELRTPLSAIRSASQNLVDGLVRTPEQTQQYGLIIEKESRRLSEMVLQVLEFAGINSRKIVSEWQAVSVPEIISEAIRDVKSSFGEEGLCVETEVPANLPMIRGDASAIRRVLDNLLTNSFKYSGESKWARVHASVARGKSGDEVILRVEDRGMGIPRPEQRHVFEPFFRGEKAFSDQIQGTGLGLSLVRQLVEAHKGSIRIESTEGRGTVVELRFPAVRSPGK
jgi:signal transduction histidine kinase